MACAALAGLAATALLAGSTTPPSGNTPAFPAATAPFSRATALVTPADERLASALAFSSQEAPTAILPGIDVWRQRRFAPLEGRRIGLITNPTGRAASGRLTAEILAASADLELAALFSPEHGFLAVEEGQVDPRTDAATGLPIFSLYGETRRPSDEMLAGIEALVFDIQDIGTRFYTYATTMAYAMEEAAARGLPFVVLDRPNPITGSRIQGPVLGEALLSFVGYAPLPLRHGMTIGELARYFNSDRGIGADLTVVPMQGWRRELWYDATGLLWVNPSPNMRNLEQALLYPAVGPLETTNVSVGRGTDEPFEWFGAPWIDGLELASRLNAARLPGVRFVPRRRTPTSSVFAGELCHGVDIVVTDRNVFAAGRTAITLATSLWQLHGEAWTLERFPRLWGQDEVVGQIRTGMSPDEIAAGWQAELSSFREARRRYLLYE